MTELPRPGPLSRATVDPGSARKGVAHWWLQRVTAVALIPLALWLAASLIANAGDDYRAFIEWLREPLVTIAILLLLPALFLHLALGLVTVAEDYAHRTWVRMALVVSIGFACSALCVAGITAVLSIAGRGW